MFGEGRYDLLETSILPRDPAAPEGVRGKVILHVLVPGSYILRFQQCFLKTKVPESRYKVVDCTCNLQMDGRQCRRGKRLLGHIFGRHLKLRGGNYNAKMEGTSLFSDKGCVRLECEGGVFFHWTVSRLGRLRTNSRAPTMQMP